MVDTSEGAKAFADMALQTFGRCAVSIDGALKEDDFALGKEDMIVLLGVVGAWRGAVAFRFDPKAIDAIAQAMAGEPVSDDPTRYEALLEAVNIVAGRGAACLAEAADSAVWLTPPLLAHGDSLQLRLQNLAGNCFEYVLGQGVGGILFSAAPDMGGQL